MAITQTLIESATSSYNGAFPCLWLMSDGRLIAYLRRQNGSNWDHVLFKSDDGGATWTQAHVMLSNTTNAHVVRMVGNKFYIINAPNVVNTAMYFWRVDYDSVLGTFTNAVGPITLKTAQANITWSRSGVDVAPSGRIWIGYVRYDGVGAWYYVGTIYSDNGGSSWSQGMPDNSGFQSQVYYSVDNYRVHVECFDLCTLILYTGKTSYLFASTGRAHYCRHADDPSSGWAVWGVGTPNLQGTHYAMSAQLSEATKQNCVFVVVDQGTTPCKMFFRRIVINAGGTPEANSVTEVSMNSGAVGIAYITGFTDGYRVYYVESTSTTTLRYREMEKTGSAFGSESTLTTSPGPVSWGNILPYQTWNAVKSAHHALLLGSGSAGSYSSYILREGIPDAVLPSIFDFDFASSARIQRLVDGAMPSSARLQAVFNGLFPSEASWDGAVGNAGTFPSAARLNAVFDTVFPSAANDTKSQVSKDAAFPSSARKLLSFDGVFASAAKAVSEWDKEAALSDVWAKESPGSDDWTKETPTSDDWSKV